MIFIKYYIYSFSDCIGKIHFKVLFFNSSLYQCFLISIHFFLVCKLASILSFTKSQFAFTFAFISTPISSITSDNLVIFYLIEAILSSIFYKKDNFDITEQLFPFLIYLFLCFSANSLHKSKNCDIKCCPNNEFFSTELIKITGDINSAEMLMSSRYFALNKLRIKRNECFKFYYLLILLSGDVGLNPGPSQYLPYNDDKFEPSHKRGLHFLHINVNSLLSRIDELRDVVGHTKPAI